MQYRRVGNTDLVVSELGFGMGRIGGTIEDNAGDEAIATLREAFHHGITFYDTANIYAQGRSEQMLAKVFDKNRHQIVIATKVGYRLSTVGMVAGYLKPFVGPALASLSILKTSARKVASRQKAQDFSAAHIESAIDSSLRRLATDYIDILQLHNPDPATLVDGGCLDVLEQAKKAGKIRAYGIACATVSDAHPCLEIPSISSIQMPFSLLERQDTPAILQKAEVRNVGVFARQPLASGFLSAPSWELRREQFSTSVTEFQQMRERAAAYSFLCKSASRSLPQSAIMYVLQQNTIASVIVGMRSRAHLHHNLDTYNVPPLTRAELQQIEVLTPRS